MSSTAVVIGSWFSRSLFEFFRLCQMTFFRILKICVFLLFLLGCGFVAGGAWWLYASSRVLSSFEGSRSVSVKPGMNTRDIARALKDAEIISSALVFRLFVSYRSVGNQLRPGDYDFSSSESFDDIIGKLIHGREESILVTVPEGLSITEVAARIERAGLTSSAEFLEAVSDKELLQSVFSNWPEVSSPEGLAFPETYKFPKGASARAIAEVMLKMTKKTFDDLMAESPEQELSPYQLCILASVVERETRLRVELPLVSSVFHNRLKRKMRLESCATVIYALGEHRDRLTFEDLKVASPYNTYLNEGLPPTPIANFGRAALKATLNPAGTDFLFFVSDANGGHKFSRTLSEHNRATKEFFQKRRDKHND